MQAAVASPADAAVCTAASLHPNILIVGTDVRCWAFNPPGALVSADLSAVMSSFCTSVVSLPERFVHTRTPYRTMSAMCGSPT